MIAYIKSFSILLFIDPGKIKMGKGAAGYPHSEYNGKPGKTKMSGPVELLRQVKWNGSSSE